MRRNAIRSDRQFSRCSFVFVFLCMALFASSPAYAAITELICGGETFTTGLTGVITRTNWEWDGSATPPTLTLAGYTGGQIRIECNNTTDQAKLVFSGTNTVNYTGVNPGIYCQCNLTIDGSGTLAVTSDGDGISSSGRLTILGSGTVNATSTSNGGAPFAIYGSGGVEITGSATVSATASGTNSYGITTANQKTITINTTGTVTATASAHALGGGVDIIIDQGTVNVSSAGTSIFIASGKSLTVASAAILNNLAGTIKNTNGGTFTNSGTINNSGTIDNTGGAITNNGTINSTTSITGNQPTTNPVVLKTITVGTQSDTLTQGTAGNASFSVTTTNITGTTQLLTLVGTIPSGVTVDSTIALSSNTGTFKIYTTAVTPAGTYPLRVMIDSMVSAQTFDLVVDSPGGGPGPNPTTTPVSGVTLDKSTLPLIVGGTGQLTHTVAPSNATNKAVTWSTSDPKVATVDANGKVTAVGPGTCTITVTTTDGGFTKTCSVTVTAPATPVTGVMVSPTTLVLRVGQSSALAATVAPANATNRNVTWSSGNPAAATVDGTGKVTAVAVGDAAITVKTEDGGKTATCLVKVTDTEIVVDLNDLGLVGGKMRIEPGEEVDVTITGTPEGLKFEATGLPDGLTLTGDGHLTGKVPTPGTYPVTLTVTAPDGTSKTVSFTVEVTEEEVIVKNGGGGGGCNAAGFGLMALALGAALLKRR